MANTIEQQVLSMIAANPGITVRQIHALRPAIKPVNSTTPLRARVAHGARAYIARIRVCN